MKTVLFLQNKYTRWYDSIIEHRRCTDTIVEYYERHHIIPKSVGGSDEPENIVRLTARERLKSHWAKMTHEQRIERGRRISDGRRKGANK